VQQRGGALVSPTGTELGAVPEDVKTTPHVWLRENETVARVSNAASSCGAAILALSAMALACGGEVCALNGGTGNATTDGEIDADAGPSAQQRWVEYCSIMTTCGLSSFYTIQRATGGGANLMTQCVADQLASTMTPAWGNGEGLIWLECVLAGGHSCESARACTNNGNADTSCDEDTPGTDFACQGDIELWCSGGEQFVVDCLNLRASCLSGFGCALGVCTQIDSKNDYCQGDVIGYCTTDDAKFDAGPGYFIPQSPCSNYGGSSCSNSAGCVGPGPACTDDRCDGDTLVSCLAGHEARLDCTDYGLDCLSDKDPDTDLDQTTAAFCGLGTECGYDYADSCKGSVLTYCNAGKIATLDCAAAGWSTCLSDGNGTRCSP
jgi:hypothetical protein